MSKKQAKQSSQKPTHKRSGVSERPIDWDKTGGLIPAIVQDARDKRVLMLGYMNPQALEQTQTTELVTFYSRSKKRLWVKGETSGNSLAYRDMAVDCDGDTLLVFADPKGPVCHTGAATCFEAIGAEQPQTTQADPLAILADLVRLIAQRERERPVGSYTTSLFEAGLKRVAQKVGEEGLETALAAAAGAPEEVIEETADLIYHLLVLLQAKGVGLDDVLARLAARMRS
ncbi:MAG: bifunctional phosphoribosyl-AMP cyclohydrolase/phosphoribosyl-ATP diphosphatase HisIE [Pseudomonadota bacterium]